MIGYILLGVLLGLGLSILFGVWCCISISQKADYINDIGTGGPDEIIGEFDSKTKKEVKGTIKSRPRRCPNCNSYSGITYERFALKYGEYICDNCGWAMDAFTGEITSEGETW